MKQLDDDGSAALARATLKSLKVCVTLRRRVTVS